MSEPRKTESMQSLIDWFAWLNVVDDVDNARIGIDLVHHEIHDGCHFTTSLVDADVDIAGPKYFRITTPNTAVRIHFIGIISADGACLIEFYENPSLNAAGSALAEYNNDRNSSAAATATTFEDSTTQPPNNDGTLLFASHIGAGEKKNSVAGETAQRQEWILKQNEDYLIKVTAEADDTHVVITGTWYEVS